MSPRVGPFSTPGAYFDKIGRGSPDKATYQSIKALCLVVSDKKIFLAL